MKIFLSDIRGKNWYIFVFYFTGKTLTLTFTYYQDTLFKKKHRSFLEIFWSFALKNIAGYKLLSFMLIVARIENYYWNESSYLFARTPEVAASVAFILVKKYFILQVLWKFDNLSQTRSFLKHLLGIFSNFASNIKRIN